MDSQIFLRGFGLRQQKSKDGTMQGLSFYQLLKAHLLNLLSQFRRPNTPNYENKSAFGMNSFACVVQGLQLLSILTSCRDSYDLSDFWLALRYIRIEWFFFEISSLWNFWIFTEVVVGLEVFALILAISTLDRYPRIFRLSNFVIMTFSSNLFACIRLPFQVILITAAKYSTLSNSIMSEFDDAAASNFNGVFVQIASVLTLIALKNCEILGELLHAQISLIKGRYTVSKVSSVFDIEVGTLQSFIVALYFVVGHAHPTIFSICVLACSARISYRLYKLFVFNSVLLSFVHLSTYLVLALSATAEVLEISFGNRSTNVILTLFCSPFLCFLAWHSATNRNASLEIRAKISNAFIAEELPSNEDCIQDLRSLANQVASADDQNQILDHFNLIRKKSRNSDGMLDVIEILFCIEFMEDNKLAYLKLCNLNRPGLSLQAYIAQARLRGYLQDTQTGEEIYFIRFMTDLEKTKQLDFEVTLAYYKLWHEFNLEKPDNLKIEKCIKDIKNDGDAVRLKYSKILNSYPKNKIACSLYFSFLTTVLAEAERNKTVEMLKAGLSLQEKHRICSSLRDLFTSDHGIIIVSAALKNFAKILYVNEDATVILGRNKSEIIGQSIDDYIPRPVKAFHSSMMKTFIEAGKSVNIVKPFNLFMLDCAGFLLDCNVVIRLTTLNDSPVFLISFGEKPCCKELAIVDDNGKILAHSQNLKRSLNATSERLEDEFVDVLLPLEFQSLKMFEAKEVQTTQGPIKLCLVASNFTNLILKVLFVFRDDEEFMKWKTQNNSQDIRNLSKLKADYAPVHSLMSIHSNRGLRSSRQFLHSPQGTEIPQMTDQNAENEVELGKEGLNKRRSLMSIAKFGEGSSRFWFKVANIALNACSIVALCGCICTLFYVTLSIKELDEVSYLESFDHIPTELVTIGMISKISYLAKMGISLFNPMKLLELTDNSRVVLTQETSKLLNFRQGYRDNGYEQVYDDDYLLDWRLLNDTDLNSVATTKLNLIDSLQRFISSAEISSNASEVAHLYHNFRNGLGETFKVVNATAEMFLQRQHELLCALDTDILVILSISAFCMLFCVVAIAVSMGNLQVAFSQLISQLASIDTNQAERLKVEIKERVKLHFETDLREELEAVDLYDHRRSRTSTSHPLTISYRIWKKIGALLVLFCIVFFSMSIIYYQVCFQNLKTTIFNYTERAYIASQLKIGSLYVVASVVELKYSTSSEVLLNVRDLMPFPKEMVSQALHDFKFQYNKLYDSKFEQVNFGLKDSLGQNFGCNSSYLNFGLDPGIVLQHIEISAYEAGSPTEDDLRRLLLVCYAIAEQQVKIVDSVFDARDYEIFNHMNSSKSVMAAFSLLIAVLALVMKKVLNGVKTDMIGTIQIVKKISH